MSSTLHFGLIGLGNFGKHYARLLGELPNTALTIVANRRAEAFNTYRNLLPLGILKTTNSAELLNHPEIDCVIIATPASTHFSLASEALRAGKHVLVEKPMAMSIAEANELLTLAKKNNRIYMIGYQYVYNDYVVALKKLLPKLGAIQYIFGEHQSPGPLRNDIGVFADAGIHDLSIIYFFFNPGPITQTNGNALGLTATKSEDFASVSVLFTSGLKAHILTARYAPEKTRKFTVVGELGMAQINDHLERNKLRFWPYKYPKSAEDAALSSIYFNLPEPEIPVVAAREPLRNELEHFINCVRQNNQPITGVDFGHEVTQACLTIQTAIERL